MEKGEKGFEQYYSIQFGDRWPSLKAALLSEKKHISIQSPYGVANPYLMDEASTYAVKALKVVENQSVLDLCAAPGGKSLLIRYSLGETGQLTCNELSRDRRHRLLGVIDEYIPVGNRSNIKVTGHDASKWCLHEKEAYDSILLDAPCSSERHLLHSSKHLKEWSIARTKQLAQRQWSMLSSAFQVLKSGGRMVYSTCALSELENDMVVERLIKKYEDRFSFSNDAYEIGEKTKYGWIILPDVTGFGPIYFCSIDKN